MKPSSEKTQCWQSLCLARVRILVVSFCGTPAFSPASPASRPRVPHRGCSFGLMAEAEEPAETAEEAEARQRENYAKREVAAEWRVPLGGRVFRVEFEHGTASGRRVLWVDEREILRRDWMFKLVGEDAFHLDGVRCILRVDPAPGFKYSYSLFVGGQAFDQFTERQARALKAWEVTVRDKFYRIVLEKDSLNVYLNGKLREEVGEFVEGGADTTFQADGNVFILHSRSSGNKRTGIIHSVTVNGAQVSEVDIK